MGWLTVSQSPPCRRYIHNEARGLIFGSGSESTHKELVRFRQVTSWLGLGYGCPKETAVELSGSLTVVCVTNNCRACEITECWVSL